MFASCFKEMKLRTCSFPRKRNGKKATGKVDRKRGRKRGREMWRKEGEEGRKKGKEGTWGGQVLRHIVCKQFYNNCYNSEYLKLKA